MKKILLLGATGRTGKLVLDLALKNGCQVHCLGRNIDRLKKEAQLTLFEGNPNNKNNLTRAISDCDAVISVLNISRKSDVPWSALQSPKTLMSDTLKKLIDITQEHKIKRIVVCTAWGVGKSKDELPKWFRYLIDISNIKYAYRDHERQENLLMNTDLDWTIVRPVGLSNSKKSRKNYRNNRDENKAQPPD
jgi:putative NADH-flavin reductase